MADENKSGGLLNKVTAGAAVLALVTKKEIRNGAQEVGAAAGTMLQTTGAKFGRAWKHNLVAVVHGLLKAANYGVSIAFVIELILMAIALSTDGVIAPSWKYWAVVLVVNAVAIGTMRWARNATATTNGVPWSEALSTVPDMIEREESETDAHWITRLTAMVEQLRGQLAIDGTFDRNTGESAARFIGRLQMEIADMRIRLGAREKDAYHLKYGPDGNPLFGISVLLSAPLVMYQAADYARMVLITDYHVNAYVGSSLWFLSIGILIYWFVNAALIVGVTDFAGKSGDFAYGVTGALFRTIETIPDTTTTTENSHEVLPGVPAPLAKMTGRIRRYVHLALRYAITSSAISLFIFDYRIVASIVLMGTGSALVMWLLSFCVEPETIEKMERFRAWMIYGIVTVLGALGVLSVLNMVFHWFMMPAYDAKGVQLSAAHEHAMGPYELLRHLIQTVWGVIAAVGCAIGGFFSGVYRVLMTLGPYWSPVVFIVAIAAMMLMLRHWHPEGRKANIARVGAVLAFITVAVLAFSGLVLHSNGQTMPDRAEAVARVTSPAPPPPRPVDPAAQTAAPTPQPPEPGVLTQIHDYFLAPNPASESRGVPGGSSAPATAPSPPAGRASHPCPPPRRSISGSRYAHSSEFDSLDAVYGH